MKLLISISRGPIAKLNDLKLQEVLKKKWPTARVLNSRLMSGDQRNAEYAYITADANSGNYMINRVVLGATGLGSSSFKVEKTSPAYGDFETLYDAVNALHRMDAPDTGRSTSNSPPLSSLTYYLADFMIQAGPEIDKLLIDWRNEQTIAPLAYACYNPREDSVELQLIEASRDHRQWIKDKFFDALQELFKKVNHRMAVSIPISTRENFRRESVQSESALKSKTRIQEPYMKIIIQVRAAGDIESTSATKFKVKDGVLYIPSGAKAAFSKAISEISKAGELIKKGAPLMDFYDDSSKLQHGNPGRYKQEAAKRKASKTEYVAAHKEAAKHIQAAKAALKEAGYGSIRPAFGSEIITKNGKSNISYVNKFKPDTFRAPGKDERLKVKFIEESKLKSISGALAEDSEVIQSESAAKAPSYKTAKVNGATALVIPSDKRAAVTEISGHIKAAITFGKGYLKYKAATDKAVEKAQNPKAKSFQKVDARKDAKEARAIAANNRKNAKLSLKSANAAARKHGLGGLIFSVNSETVFDPKVLKAAKSTEFGVTGKRGKFKPKFAKQAVFDNLGVKALSPANKKPSHAESVKRVKKQVAEKAFKRNKGAVAGAYSPAKKKEVAAKRVAALTGKKPEGSATAEKVDKALPGILKAVGFKFNVGRDAGLIRNQKGGKIAKSNEGLAKMREKLAKKFPVQDTPNGFEIPGLLQVKTGPTGVVIVRPDRYVKANDPAVRVRK